MLWAPGHLLRKSDDLGEAASIVNDPDSEPNKNPSAKLPKGNVIGNGGECGTNIELFSLRIWAPKILHMGRHRQMKGFGKGAVECFSAGGDYQEAR